MQILACKKPGELEYKEEVCNLIKPGHSLLKVKAIGICGTDLHAFEGTQPYFTYPRVLGHEIAAEIVETMDPNFQKGQSVTVLPYFNCGECVACQKGKGNCCVSLQVFGVHIDGGMKELIQVPDSSLIAGEGLRTEELALVEPFSIALHAVKRAKLEPREFVLIVGAGPIGIATAIFATERGAKVLLLDVHEDRLAAAKQMVEELETYNVRSGSAVEKLQEFSKGTMAHVVFDASGNLEAINSSFQYLAHTGRYVLIGLQAGAIQFSHPEFHKREATLMSSRNADRSDFEEVISFLKTRKINLAHFITHKIGFEKLGHKFQDLLDPNSMVIKALVEF
ncbi:zinc-binding alcohol dehydrogenase family protein [Sphingobacterium mizutaii]|uniref:zinc-binding alcohol dehydrogenase family protein n=1 Tax=Sphingobacterium mizutaii TaxID=1010 RepID=UPI001628AEE2|nr:zinc-binding alcohol dehydrogenase family protein [Sphingobacterium mizutaii]